MLNWSGRKFLGMLVLALAVPSLRAQTAAFDLIVTPSTNQVPANQTLVYTITVTNTSAVIVLSTPTVVAAMPPSVIFKSATNPGGTFSNNNGVVTFRLSPLAFGQGVSLGLVVQPTVVGTFTNIVVASSPEVPGVQTNVVTTVVEAAATGSLLSGSIRLSSPAAILGDDVTYGLSVTNLGSNASAGVVLSNGFSAAALFRGVSPAVQVTSNNNSLLFFVGSLAGGAFTNFQVTIQPTAAGPLTLTAGASSPNSVSNTVGSVTLQVVIPNTNQLQATIASVQTYNPQTGLIEQMINLQNVGGTSTVASARVVVQGLANRLYNAVGTNSGNPFVVYAQTLAPDETVQLILEYFIPTRLAVPDPILVAYEVPTNNLVAPTSSPPNITLVTSVPTGVLIEFESVPDHAYLILYSDTADFANALIAQPPVIAPASRVQWIDDGPPKTISPPGAARFYRVIETP